MVLLYFICKFVFDLLLLLVSIVLIRPLFILSLLSSFFTLFLLPSHHHILFSFVTPLPLSILVPFAAAHNPTIIGPRPPIPRVITHLHTWINTVMPAFYKFLVDLVTNEVRFLFKDSGVP